jgi:hypothetical protein
MDFRLREIAGGPAGTYFIVTDNSVTIADVTGTTEANGNWIITRIDDTNFDLVNSVLKIMEDRLDKIEEDLKTKKKVYNVLVEILQNLCHHLDEAEVVEGDMDGRTALLIIQSDNKGYSVVTGNYIFNERIPFLKSRLDEINSVSKDELRDLYKKILNNNQF